MEVEIASDITFKQVLVMQCVCLGDTHRWAREGVWVAPPKNGFNPPPL